MDIQTMEVSDYTDNEKVKQQEWPVDEICTKCGNEALEHLTAVGINDEQDHIYEFGMIRCYKCGTRWYR